MSKKIVFFDLDGTILDGVSSENAFIVHLMKHGKLKLKQYLAALFFVFNYAVRYKQNVFVKNKAYLKGLKIDDIEKIAEIFVKENLFKRIRPKLLAIIRKHKQAGDLLVLLTGSPDFLSKHLAKNLQMDLLEPTKCAKEGNAFSCNPPLQHPFAEQKLEIAQRICKEYKINIKDCVAYGNSYNDRILLREVGYAIAVTPSRRLRKIAEQEGWEIID